LAALAALPAFAAPPSAPPAPRPEGAPSTATIVLSSPSAAPARPASPCASDPRYRAFDYWLGTWDVYPTGQPRSGPASENVVTSEYGGCVVQEHWTGADGSSGTSFNLYDRATKEWHQIWVDAGGRLAHLRGGPDARGNLVYLGERPARPDEVGPVPTRLSFERLGPDTVRQFGEASKDGGKTWIITFDLTYYRRGSAAGS
jgi:hypothetical protein